MEAVEVTTTAMERVSVSVRIRPLSDTESVQVWRPMPDLPGHIHLVDPVEGPVVNNVFAYDNVFDTSASTVDVFNTVGRKLALSAVEGINSTIFAYGQVGAWVLVEGWWG